MENIKMVERNIKIVERKHVCPHCDFRTHKKYNLTMHIARIHKDLFPPTVLPADLGLEPTVPTVDPTVPQNFLYPTVHQIGMNQELLEDSIHVLNIYNMLQKMKNKHF